MAEIKEVKIGDNIYVIRDQNALPKSGGTMTGPLVITSNLEIKDSYLLFNREGVNSVRIQTPSTGENRLEVKDGDNMSLVPINCSQVQVNGITSKQIISTYTSGTSGYRIWSDGYCEQWGVLSGSGTLSFLKTWANTNYQVFGNVKNGTDVVFSLSTSSYTTISCYYLCQYHKEDDWRGVPSEPFFWRAYGYLASGQY